MSINTNIKQSYLPINRWKGWLFCLLSATLILACTGDLDNDGYALVSPSFGITIIPQNPQILKTGNQTFTAIGGVTPYTYSLSATDIGTIVPATGVFTALEIAGTATVTAVDSTGVSGTTAVTVLPTLLAVVPGTAVNTAAGVPVNGATVVLTSSLGTLSAASFTTVNGLATGTLTAGDTAGTAYVVATVENVSATTTVSILSF